MLAVALALCLHSGFLDDSRNANNTGLGVLGAWSAASIVVGAAGWLIADDPVWVGAHQANLVWGVVNAAFAVFGLYMGLRPDAANATIADARNTQFVYAINTAFDLGYVALAAIFYKLVDSPRWKGIF